MCLSSEPEILKDPACGPRAIHSDLTCRITKFDDHSYRPEDRRSGLGRLRLDTADTEIDWPGRNFWEDKTSTRGPDNLFTRLIPRKTTANVCQPLRPSRRPWRIERLRNADVTEAMRAILIRPAITVSSDALPRGWSFCDHYDARERTR